MMIDGNPFNGPGARPEIVCGPEAGAATAGGAVVVTGASCGLLEHAATRMGHESQRSRRGRQTGSKGSVRCGTCVDNAPDSSFHAFGEIEGAVSRLGDAVGTVGRLKHRARIRRAGKAVREHLVFP